MQTRSGGARVVHHLAVVAGETLGAGTQVRVRFGVLAGAPVLAGLVGAAVVQIWGED